MRKQITKKTRFDVFKRDKFTCQYCGKTAPDVKLEIDHIKPVSKGGDNNILNLITSCYDCNRGKRDGSLNINESIKKEIKQLKVLQEQKEQLEMLLKWRDELNNINNKKYKIVYDAYMYATNEQYVLNDYGKKQVKNLVDKHGVIAVLDAIDIVKEKKIRIDEDGKVNKTDASNLVNNVSKQISFSKMKPLEKEIAYYKGIVKNHFKWYSNGQYIAIPVSQLIIELKKIYQDEEIIEMLKGELKEYILTSINIKEWKSYINDYTEYLKNEVNK